MPLGPSTKSFVAVRKDGRIAVVRETREAGQAGPGQFRLEAGWSREPSAGAGAYERDRSKSSARLMDLPSHRAATADRVRTGASGQRLYAASESQLWFIRRAGRGQRHRFTWVARQRLQKNMKSVWRFIVSLPRH